MVSLLIHPVYCASKRFCTIIYKYLFYSVDVCSPLYTCCYDSWHYIPLGQRPAHLRVDKVRFELPFPFNIYNSSAWAHVAQCLQNATRLFCNLKKENTYSKEWKRRNARERRRKTYLYFSKHSCAVHSARYIHRVTPDVILRFLSSNHSSYHRSMINTCK